MDAVWPDVVVEENNLSVQLSNLRRALDADRELGSCIQTLPGRGYRFLPAVTLSGHRLADRAQTADPTGVSFDDAAGTASAEPAPDPSNADPTLPHPSAPADGHRMGSNRHARRHRTGWVVAACVLLAVLIASIVWPAALAPPIGGASKTAMAPSTATQDAPTARMPKYHPDTSGAAATVPGGPAVPQAGRRRGRARRRRHRRGPDNRVVALRRPSDNSAQFSVHLQGEARRYPTRRPGTRRALRGRRQRAQAGRRAAHQCAARIGRDGGAALGRALHGRAGRDR